MTTINDISDLVKILQERPEWRATISNLLMGEELLSLPRQLAQFIEATNENFRLVNENSRRVDENLRELNEHARLANENLRELNENSRRVDENLRELNEHARLANENLRQLNENSRLTNERLNRLEGRFGNMEGKDYERSVGNRATFRAERHFGLNNPVIAMSQYSQKTPGLNRLLARAIQSGVVTDEAMDDLYGADIIISDDNNRYVVIEVSLTVDSSDIERAVRRADIMAAVSGAESMSAVVTENIPEPQRDMAQERGVAVFVIPNR